MKTDQTIKPGMLVLCISNDDHPSYLLVIGGLYEVREEYLSIDGTTRWVKLKNEPYAYNCDCLLVAENITKLEKIIWRIK